MGFEGGNKHEKNDGPDMTRRRFLAAGASAAALAAIGLGPSSAEARDREPLKDLPEGCVKVSVGVVTGILPNNFAGMRNLLYAIGQTEDVSFTLSEDDLASSDWSHAEDFGDIVYLEYRKHPGEYQVARGMVDLVGLKSIHVDPRALDAFLSKHKKRVV